MADATPAAPAAPASPAPAAAADSTAPVEKKDAQQAAIDEVVGDTGEDLPAELSADGTPAAKAEKKAVEAAKKYKLKVGGKDLDVDEGELLKRAQMGYSADQKWQEAAEIKRKTDALIQALQTNPERALEQMGFDVDKMAEERIRRKIEEMQKSPEQLAQEKMQARIKELEDERESEKQQVQQREMQRLQDQFAIEIENDISSALDDQSNGFPKSPYVVKRIADLMIAAVNEGMRTNNQQLKNITAKDVLPLVRDEILREQRELYALTPDEVFENLVGKDRLNKYRRGKIKKTAKPASANEVKSTGTKELQRQTEERDKAAKKLSSKDFFKTLGSGKV